MDREDFIVGHLYGGWRKARESRAIYKNVRGHNVAVMTDENDPDVWTWVITPEGEKAGDWSREKYDTEEDAKRGALEALADRLGYSGFIVRR